MFWGEQWGMEEREEMAGRVLRLEEQQMYLERLVDELSGEVRELSKLLEVARAELRRLETELRGNEDEDGSAGGSAEE